MNDETRHRPAPLDEERLAALDDVTETSLDASPEAFAAAVDDIVALHGDLLARLAQ
ncbi:hypothetical protein QEZ54_04000 [Catellatospora sp. KI3]|uniref:hypothetical protein n=1 Tax=Catellatospora sp. KI3 TaxID=3041620 RepID=UPI002482DD75|nr:hypothetical protein [Catellatospora sp. KI3]MDI1460123.1 hypothetical protein [Catellatospora sp. KI3]